MSVPSFQVPPDRFSQTTQEYVDQLMQIEEAMWDQTITQQFAHAKTSILRQGDHDSIMAIAGRIDEAESISRSIRLGTLQRSVEQAEQAMQNARKTVLDSKIRAATQAFQGATGYSKEAAKKAIDLAKSAYNKSKPVVEQAGERLRRAKDILSQDIKELADATRSGAKDAIAKAGAKVEAARGAVRDASSAFYQATADQTKSLADLAASASIEAGNKAVQEIMGFVMSTIKQLLGPLEAVYKELAIIAKRMEGELKQLAAAGAEVAELELHGVVTDEVDTQMRNYSANLIDNYQSATSNIPRTLGDAEALDRAIATGDLDVFIPSSTRYFCQVSDALAELRQIGSSAQGFLDMLIKPIRAVFLVLRAAVSGVAAASAKILEKIVGEYVVRVAQVAAEASAEIAFRALSWWFSVEAQLVLFGIAAISDAVKLHNWSRWLDDMIQRITLGLAPTPDSIKFAEYPDFTQVLHKGGEDDPTQVKEERIPFIFEMSDYREYKVTIDFWAAQWKKLAKTQGHTYKPYRPLPPFQGLIRRTGKYIKLPNNPQASGVSDAELRKSQELEQDLAAGYIVDENNLTPSKGADLAAIFPKDPRKGPRNLSAFPYFSSSFTWPNPAGQFVSLQGTFTRSEMDPDIVALFELWAKQGTYGPHYNMAKTRTAQLKAMKANQLDLQQFLQPSLDYPPIWGYIDLWVKSASGRRALGAIEMPRLTLQEFQRLRTLRSGIRAPQGFDTIPYPQFQIPVEWFADKGLPMYWNVVSDTPSSYTGYTVQMLEAHRVKMGYYPVDGLALEFYNTALTQGILVRQVVTSAFQTRLPLLTRGKVESAERPFLASIQKFVNSYNQYMGALDNTHKAKKAAVESELTQQTFNLWVEDTKELRKTTWDYIRMFKHEFVAQLMFQTQSWAHSQHQDIMRAWANAVKGADIPLNQNAYHRLLFVGRFAEAVYAIDPNKYKEKRKEMEKVTGPWLSHQLITTGITGSDIASWAARTAISLVVETPFPKDIIKGDVDLAVLMGNLHATITVIANPAKVVILAFKGTQNFWEWVIDFDFSQGDFGSIRQHGKNQQQYDFGVSDSADTKGEVAKLELWDSEAQMLVHSGFLRAWNHFKTEVNQALYKVYQAHPDVQDLIVTGHSLGAGIAGIAAIEVPAVPRSVPVKNKYGMFMGRTKIQYVRPHVYLFSSPAIGDTRYSHHFLTMTSETVNVFMDGDFITMVPPFLIPSQNRFFSMWRDSKQLIERMADITERPVAGIAGLLSFAFKAVNLPFDLTVFGDGHGNWDKDKIAEGMSRIYFSWNEHRAVRAAGSFLRLTKGQPDLALEVPGNDPGSTTNGLKDALQAVANIEDKRAILLARHDISNVLTELESVAQRYPDFFADARGRMPQWSDAGTFTPGHHKKIPHKTQELLTQGEIIGYAETKHHHHAWSIVGEEDILAEQSVMFPFTVNELAGSVTRAHKRQRLESGQEYFGHGHRGYEG